MKDEKNTNLKGKDYWRSLDQLAETPEFKEFLHREFPQGASEFNNNWSRRNFLTLMGASMALAGLAGCRRPEQKIVPYVKPPEEIIPGVPQYYATTMPMGTSAYGVIVETHEGRPTKIEGNPKHPSTLGASNAWIQASILGLYDPDRSARVMHDGQESSWDEFVAFWRESAVTYDANGGAGLAVLSEPSSSPTMRRLEKKYGADHPRTVQATYAPVGDENIYSGIESATGRAYKQVFDLNRADVIVSLDSDFLLTESDNIAASRAFVDGRRLKSENDDMNRLYVVETGFSTTGAAADHRIAVSHRDVGRFMIALARALKSRGLSLPDIEVTMPPGDEIERWVGPVTDDLIAAGTKAVVMAGSGQPAELHALTLAVNNALGSIGNCVKLYESDNDTASDLDGLKSLCDAMRQGKIDTLVMLGGDPCFNVPSDLEFMQAMMNVETRIHLSDYYNLTSRQSTWHIPRAHYSESWGDASAADGTRSIIQPLIAPLFDGIATAEMVNLMATGTNSDGYDIVRETWQNMLGRNDFENKWRKVLHDGVWDVNLPKEVSPRIDSGYISKALTSLFESDSSPREGMEFVFAASPSLHDGRFANNGWLQELPHPITKLTWDNAALISPKTAKDNALKNEDIVKLLYKGREIEIPVWIVPGMADNTVLLELGYGQKNLGRVADGVGVNTYALRTSDAMYYGSGLTITTTGKTYKLASTQDHGSIEGRPHVREASLEEYREHPNFAPEAVHHPPLVSMWDDHKYDQGYQWGMTIDLTACTGCNACTIACQSENNIPIVGKEQIGNGREMHWIRVDRYFTGEVDNPQVVHQPVACQHCEMAPCEQVCPVAATVHDKEGLNTMVYNRCIGTRYCANNCPYKVRRFNFFNFTKDTPEVTKMVHNPDVTVRSRGVMEKCTFCVQRINRAKIEAKKENRTIADGEVTAACQQACPAQAIVFGNINDSDSRVSKIKKQNRNYSLLGELNVRPRTSYLAKIRNPNPKMPKNE